MSASEYPDICYLCGEVMGADRTRDHVPAQSFFPAELRRQKNYSRLDVVWAHAKCNGAYKLDEQYFFHALAPLAGRTEVGPAIWRVVDKPILSPAEVRLRQKILREFSWDRNGRLRKTFDKPRVDRVIKKIIRGLWFLRYKEVMPECWKLLTSFHDPDNPPPAELMAAVQDHPTAGFYPEVFFSKSHRSTDPSLSAWMLFFWDWFVVVATVHETGCSCFKCQPERTSSTSAV
jgi:hypothetical protein